MNILLQEIAVISKIIDFYEKFIKLMLKFYDFNNIQNWLRTLKLNIIRKSAQNV